MHKGTPTEKQFDLLRILGAGSIALAPTRGEWKPLVRRGWVEALSEDDGKGYYPPLRITAAGLRALADGVEAYGLPGIRDGFDAGQRKEHPKVTEIKAKLAEHKELLRDSQERRRQLEVILARTRRVIDGGDALMGKACASCSTPLVPWQEAAVDDPAMDCGGDCLACIREAEGGIPSDRATLGLMAKTTAPLVLTEEQARRVAAFQQIQSSKGEKA